MIEHHHPHHHPYISLCAQVRPGPHHQHGLGHPQDQGRAPLHGPQGLHRLRGARPKPGRWVGRCARQCVAPGVSVCMYVCLSLRTECLLEHTNQPSNHANTNQVHRKFRCTESTRKPNAAVKICVYSDLKEWSDADGCVVMPSSAVEQWLQSFIPCALFSCVCGGVWVGGCASAKKCYCTVTVEAD